MENTMKKTRINDQGQLTLPASVMDDLKLSAGDEIGFIKSGDGRYELVSISPSQKNPSIDDGTSRHLSLAEMRQLENSSDQEY